MFCTKCGAQIANGQRFCSSCGAPVDMGAADGTVSVPRPEPTPAQQPAYQEPVYQQPAYQEPAYQQPVYQQPVYQQAESEKKAGKKQRAPKPPRPPKKGGSLGLIIALVAVAAIVALAALNRGAVRNLIDRTFSSPETYYQHVETREVSRYTEALAEDEGVFAAYGKAVGAEKSENFLEEEITLSIDQKVLGEEIMGLLEEETGIDLSWARSVGLYVSGGLQDKLAGGEMIALLNDTEIIGANFAIDTESGTVFASVPELSGQYLSFTGDDLGMYGASSSAATAEEIMQALPDEEVLARLVDRYTALVIKNLTKVEKGREKITAGDVSATYTTLTVKIDGKTMLRIAKDVLAELHDDRDVEDLICGYLKASGMSESEIDQVFFSFLDEIESAQEEVENTEPEDIPSTILMTVYVDAAGNIRGRDIKVRQDKELKAQISYVVVLSGTKFGLKAEFQNVSGYGTKGEGYYYKNVQDIVVSGSGKLSLKKEVSGSLDVRYKMESDYNGDTDKQDLKLAKIDFTAALEGEGVSYEINVNPGKDLIELAIEEAYDMPAAIEDLIRSAGLTLRGEIGEKRGTMEIALRNGKKDAITLSAKVNEIKPYEIVKPANPVAPETWAMGLDMSKLQDIIGHLRDAGVPASLLEGLGYLF